MRHTPPTLAALIGGFVVVSWYYLDLVHIPFIADVTAEAATEAQLALYWHLRYSALYAAMAVPWWLLYARTSYRERLAKFVWLILALMVSWGFVDLQLTGNYDTGLAEPGAFAAIVAWGCFVAWAFWRRDGDGAVLDPGAVYLIERRPRTFVEWLGTWALARWAGSVSIYVDGVHYHFDPRSRVLIAEERPHFVLRGDQRASRLSIPPGAAKAFMQGHLGQPWRLGGCFHIARQLRMWGNVGD